MKKILHKPITQFTAFSLLLIAFLLTTPALAVPLNEINNLANDNGLAKYATFLDVLKLALRGLLSLAFIVAVIFVVVAGYQLVTSQGNEEQITLAKKNLTWAVIGIVLIVASWVVLSFILTLVVSGNPGTV